MAITNHERVGKSLELLAKGLKPFVEREMRSVYQAGWFEEARRSVGGSQLQLLGDADNPEWDAAGVLVTMWNQWNEVFRKTLGPTERSIVNELRDVRNRWAHQRPFSSDDSYRALDSAARLLSAVSSREADEVERMKLELLRVRFDEQVRTEKRRAAAAAPGDATTSMPVGMNPWREIVNPHADVASGAYQKAEFAADLWQVHLGEALPEYQKPVEFFRRTYLTRSLKYLLAGAVKRLSGKGSDPVVQLQTNFGGGKTHSMLALYHLFSGANAADLPGVDEVLAEAGVASLPKVKRVVIVGNKLSPGNPARKSDGTEVRTLWGELAWQLGGKKAFDRVRADDERATSPGDVLRELFNEYGPALILIDEWVAYARQLHDAPDLPGGSFETHFTFAQALTEAAKAAKGTLLVISLPASDGLGSSHAQAEDIEVGGERGRLALDRLRNAVGRVEASWRPASADEGFEIVRRRLFEPLAERAQFVGRDAVAKEFAQLYRTQQAEFPPECRDVDYERRIRDAYPIHPEVFDRLYGDWSTLARFQRTRGVLRLMASVIHSLWVSNDRSPLILPSSIPIHDPLVQFELTRYLSDNWTPIIERDVDGPNSLPYRLDGELPNFGKFAACRRVARTIYLGSAPLQSAAHRGIEDRRVKLGCVMPGESAAIFGDALRRLSERATYLYRDAAQYWYATQPTVTKVAEDRAEQLKADPDRIVEEIRRRITLDLRERGDFVRIHILPTTSADVPDDTDTRLVVLGVEYPHIKDHESPALVQAKAALDMRGTSSRVYRNTVVFLAADKARLADLDEAIRRFLAWQSIVDDTDALDLSPHQQRQSASQRESAAAAVQARLPETYQWLIVPAQFSPQAEVEWRAFRLTGQEPLAVRASKKLKNDENIIVQLAPTRLRLELDRIPLWRTADAAEANHVPIRQLREDFARYLYLPRLRSGATLVDAACEGVALLTWSKDTFAYAEDFDGAADRYLGLRHGQQVQLSADAPIGLLVKSEVAMAQIQREAGALPQTAGQPTGGAKPGAGPEPQPAEPAAMARPRRFFGTLRLEPGRVGRDAGRAAEEVIQHLLVLPTADAEIVMEIQVRVPAGIPESAVRTLIENCRTLKFESFNFESE
jgi:predicted AAA+ superfamily ATPase